MGKIKDIAKQPLVVWNGQTVITTAQLAEVYGTAADNISDNFNRNKERFIVGKHYILLEGKALKEFKNYSAESGLVAKNARQLYLWTRRGASRHCKILGTDKAWEQFDYLEENYFDRQDQGKQTPPLTLQQQIQTIAQGTTELYERVEGLENKFTKFEQELPMLPDDADEVHDSLNKKVISLLGGKSSNAYRDKSLSKKVFMDAYRSLKYNFNVSRYKAIKRNQKAQALKIIAEYKPPFYLTEQIEAANSQQSFNFGE